MKKSALIYIVCILSVTGCSIPNKTGTTPSQNQNLNSISPTSKVKKEKGFLQQSYDNWEKEDWEPNTEPVAPTVENGQDLSSPSQKTMSESTEASTPKTESTAPTAAAAAEKQEDSNASKTFTLQEYVDKWGLYIERKGQKEGNKTVPSNAEKLETMPAIGGTR